mmetsp:Transcript_28610/g.68184  ORF Transcript_28610/g.68184 Transcript_28610/m.68184 type:complete len:215 (+) Transcript_28610:922-1566(+)
MMSPSSSSSTSRSLGDLGFNGGHTACVGGNGLLPFRRRLALVRLRSSGRPTLASGSEERGGGDAIVFAGNLVPPAGSNISVRWGIRRRKEVDQQGRGGGLPRPYRRRGHGGQQRPRCQRLTSLLCPGGLPGEPVRHILLRLPQLRDEQARDAAVSRLGIVTGHVQARRQSSVAGPARPPDSVHIRVKLVRGVGQVDVDDVLDAGSKCFPLCTSV